MDASRQPPEGTIAMLFTDIEGSTRLARALGSSWAEVLADHHALVGGAIAAEGGFVEGTAGDAFVAAFQDAAAGARAAVAALRDLRAHDWPPEVGELGVRMGLHVGRVERGTTGYVGLEVHRAARVGAAAHGGQLLLTGAARTMAADAVEVEALGLHRLKDSPAGGAVLRGHGWTWGVCVSARPDRAICVRRTCRRGWRRFLAVRLTWSGYGVAGGRAGAAGHVDRPRRRGQDQLGARGRYEMLDQHPGGVWLVSLAGVSSSGEVLAAVASAVGAEGEPLGLAASGAHSSVCAAAARRCWCSTTWSTCSRPQRSSACFGCAPDLRLLVTSQAPLRLAGERCVPLDALDDGAALALIERVARRRGAPPCAAETDRAALLEIAHLLDGLPLALELAAARLPCCRRFSFSTRLRASSDSTQGPRSGRPERHRSLRRQSSGRSALLEEGRARCSRAWGLSPGRSNWRSSS